VDAARFIHIARKAAGSGHAPDFDHGNAEQLFEVLMDLRIQPGAQAKAQGMRGCLGRRVAFEYP